MTKSNSPFNPSALPTAYMSNFEKECSSTFGEKNHFLYPGQLFISGDGAHISTILGSCAAVCLWDGRKRIGGMNHYLFPEGSADSPNPYRYGNLANEALLAQMLEMGCEPRDIQGKIFGGGSAFAADPDKSLGAQNAKAAEAFLNKSRIRVLLTDVTGKRGRRLIFNTDDGTTSFKVFDKE